MNGIWPLVHRALWPACKFNSIYCRLSPDVFELNWPSIFWYIFLDVIVTHLNTSPFRPFKLFTSAVLSVRCTHAHSSYWLAFSLSFEKPAKPIESHRNLPDSFVRQFNVYDCRFQFTPLSICWKYSPRRLKECNRSHGISGAKFLLNPSGETHIHKC